MGNSPCRTYLYWALAHSVVGPPFQVEDMCRQTVLLRGQDYEAGRIVALIHVLYIILEHVDPVWSLYNIAQVLFWVELPVQRRLSDFRYILGPVKKGTQWSGIGLPDIHKFSAG